MDPEDFFRVSDSIVKLNLITCPEEILFRSAINRLYYGVFHLVQKKFGIIVPESEVNRCHAYVKERIEASNIRSDYTDLEEFRIHADYRLLLSVSRRDYEDALRIKTRIIKILNDTSFALSDEEDEFLFYKRKEKK